MGDTGIEPVTSSVSARLGAPHNLNRWLSGLVTALVPVGLSRSHSWRIARSSPRFRPTVESPAVTKIVLRAGRATEVVTPERRAALDQLMGTIREAGYTVDLEITPYVPGRRGIAWAEAVWIYIAAQGSAVLVPRVLADVYEAAKHWARKRYEDKQAHAVNPSPETFVIYGPDGEVLKTWTVNQEGERED